ncbi:MAG: DHH family phosphoesterase [Oscillospiraceae bacterium]|nr:DHH family phosphoesterase [Oscillospiraceae bacterium]
MQRDFKLSDLIKFKNIVIQCHDNPDADAITSAFALQAFFREKGRDAKIVYSGALEITKRNIITMNESLGISISYVKAPLELKPELLVCVDCQYGEGNVARIEAESVAVIDHHIDLNKKFDLGVVQQELGSCATLIWDLMRSEGYDFSADRMVSTALYYGLYADSVNFSEFMHPLDLDMRDNLRAYCDMNLIERLRFCNLTLDELEIAGVALIRKTVDTDKRYALFRAEACDPNILGFISDLGIQADTIDICVVYSIIESGVKLSVRSCSREVMASEYVKYLTYGVGSGGGHKSKAGGFISGEVLAERKVSPSEYLTRKVGEYFNSYETICADNHDIEVSLMSLYRKKPIPLGVVIPSDIFELDTPISVRSLEGEFKFNVSPDALLIVDMHGGVHPIKSEKFFTRYVYCDEKPQINYDYVPSIINTLNGAAQEIVLYIKSCLPTESALVYAKKLKKNVKIFSDWVPDGYVFGRVGDYLAIRNDDMNDVYIIPKDIFELAYDIIP